MRSSRGLEYREFGAHSMRPGFVTTAARSGKDLDTIIRRTRQKTERVARAHHRETIHERGSG
jgi:hypothetical protein